MKYDIYESYMQRCTRKRSKKRKISEKEMLNAVVDHAYSSSNLLYLTRDYLYRQKQSPVIFIKDVQFLDFLYKIKLRGEFFAHTPFPFKNVFSVAVPRNSLVCGQKVYPLLIDNFDWEDLIESVHGMFWDVLGVPAPLKGLADLPSATIRMLIGGIDDVSCMEDRLQEFLVCNDLKQLGYGEDTDTKFLQVHFKIAMSLCAYIAAFPRALVDGFPDNTFTIDSNGHKERFNAKGRQAKMFSICDDSGNPVASSRLTKAHFRSPHLRVYRHECFERNEDGSVKVGLVKGSMVGVNVTPSTARKVV